MLGANLRGDSPGQTIECGSSVNSFSIGYYLKLSTIAHQYAICEIRRESNKARQFFICHFLSRLIIIFSPDYHWLAGLYLYFIFGYHRLYYLIAHTSLWLL